MAGGLTDTLNIRSTDTLLAGGDTSPGRGLDAEEVVLHRSHTGVDQQQAVVILRHQAEGRQPQVSLAFKKSEKALTQVVYACPFHRFSLLYSCKNDVDRKRKSLRPKQWTKAAKTSSAVPPKLHRESPVPLRDGLTRRKRRYSSHRSSGMAQHRRQRKPFSKWLPLSMMAGGNSSRQSCFRDSHYKT